MAQRFEKGGNGTRWQGYRHQHTPGRDGLGMCDFAQRCAWTRDGHVCKPSFVWGTDNAVDGIAFA